MATVIIQNRRGSYNDFDPQKLKPGEFAIVQSDDPNSSDGRAVYICTQAGVVKRLATTTEIYDEVQNASEEIAEIIQQAVEADADRAEAAADSVEASATQIATNTADIADLKSDLDDLTYDKTTSTAWEKGLFDINTGNTISTDFYIRYTGGFVDDDVVKFKISNDYGVAVFAWNRSTNAYVGIYQKDGTFAKNGTNSKAVQELDFTQFPSYKFKIAITRLPTSSSITTSEGQNLLFYTLKEESDEELDVYRGLVCSGDYAVGDDVFDSASVSAGDTLYYKTHLLEASSASGASGYIALYNSSNQRIACIGTVAAPEAIINHLRMGLIVVPEGFSYAKWAGNKSGTIEYITKYMPPEHYNKFYGNQKVDLLNNPPYSSGWCYDPTTKSQREHSAVGVTSYLPVAPKGKITITKSLHSKAIGHAFFDANLSLVAQYSSVGNADVETTYEIPENAYYVRISFLLSTLANAHAYYEAPALDYEPIPEYVLNPYTRRTIKEYGGYYLTQEFTHCLCSKLCYFNGEKVLAYRCGYTHNGAGSSSLYGSIQIDTIAPDGSLTHRGLFSASEFGCLGDARDPFVGVTKDGNALIMLVSFNRGTVQSGVWDTALVHFDKDFNVVDYKKVISNANQFAYGNPLITPEGHLIFNVYTPHNISNPPSNLNQIIYRSNEVFSANVSNLTFTSTVIFTTSLSNVQNEACLGYHNGKLYLMIRYDTEIGRIMWTDDLEGVSGWSTPIEIGAKIHAPMLLPQYDGKYLPFVASYFEPNAQYRKPVLGYLDVDTDNQTASIIGVGDIDQTLDTSANNGYPAFIHLGGENYVVSYYQEDATNTPSGMNQQSGLYYKHINAREIVSNAIYFLD